MENLEHNYLDNFADPSKIQSESAKENIELKRKQAKELADRRRKYNEELEEIRERQLKERAEKEESNAKKLTESRKALRRERRKEYTETQKKLNERDPNKKSRDLSKLKDQLNPNSEFRGAGRLLQWTGADKAAKRFVSTVQGNYSDDGIDLTENYSDRIKGRIARWFINRKSEKEKVYSHMEGHSSIPQSIERDELIINGFLPEVKLIEEVDEGKRSKDRYYLEALDRIIEFKKSKNLKSTKDKTYSAWKLLSKYSD